MYSADIVKDLIKKSIITYYSTMGYSKYIVTEEDVEDYMRVGYTTALQSGSEMYRDFAYVERCLTWVLNNYLVDDNAEFFLNMAKAFARNQNDGILRDHEIIENGVIYQPTIYSFAYFKSEIDQIRDNDNPATVAAKLYAYLIKNDLFTGNTVMLSLMAANKILLHRNIGVIYVPLEDKMEFGNIRYNYCQANGNEIELVYKLISSVYRIGSSTPLGVESRVSMTHYITNSKGETATVGDHITVYTQGGWLDPRDTCEITGFTITKDEELVVFNDGINQPVKGIIDFEFAMKKSELDELFGAANKMV